MRIHRAWLVASVTFLALICAAAFRSTTSILFMPLEMEFGWSRSLTSTALAVNLVVYGVTAPFAATLMERFSPKRVAIAALALVALGTGLTTVMTEPWQLMLYWGVFVGIGTGCLALVFASLVANRWFSQKRGLVTGVFSAAYATGQLIFLPALSTVVMVDGWRIASLVVAVFAAAVIPIFMLFFKNSPEESGVEPYGGPQPLNVSGGAAPKNARETLIVLFQAAGKPAFWILAGTFFVCGWTTNGLIGAHFIPAAHDHGMPVGTAAGLLAVVGIFDFVGTILSGWLTDRVNPVLLLVFYYGLRGLALFTVPFVLGPSVEPPLFFFIVFYGLDWIATVPPTIELCRRYFGLAQSPSIYGWVFAAHMVGAAIAAAFAGAIRDSQGSYFIAWITAAILCLIAAGSVLFLRRMQPVMA
ncbi:MAG: MFS transporter [Rhodoluna sp.]|nr:MFS transporter [Rhodoluna sp.]